MLEHRPVSQYHRGMTRIIRFVVLSILWLSLSSGAALARSEAIVAVVNDDVISRSDFADRMKMVIISSGLPNNAEVRGKLADQVISSLVEEQLRLQEANRMGLQVSQEEIRNGLQTIAQQNDMKPEVFEKALRQSGINIATMYRQIRAQIGWSKIVQSKLRSRVIVSDRDIENFQERLRNMIGSNEYWVAEIFLPVETPEKEAKTRQLANHLVGQINGGKAPFSRVAQQFSKAAGATKGGDLGWIQDGQLPDKLDKAVRAMSKNTMSKPIRSLSGYHILFLRDKRLVKEDNIPPREEIMNVIGSQRLERLQRRYFLDLKASAFIETRV